MSAVGVLMLSFSDSFVEVLECFMNIGHLQFESNIKLMDLIVVERSFKLMYLRAKILNYLFSKLQLL